MSQADYTPSCVHCSNTHQICSVALHNPYMTCWIVTSIHPSFHLSIRSDTLTHILAHNALCYRASFFSLFLFTESVIIPYTENELMNAFALNPNLGKDMRHAFVMPHQTRWNEMDIVSLPLCLCSMELYHICCLPGGSVRSMNESTYMQRRRVEKSKDEWHVDKSDKIVL